MLLHVLLRTIMLPSLAPLHPVIEEELASRARTGALGDDEFDNCVAVEPSAAAQARAVTWLEAKRDGEPWPLIWQGAYLHLRFGGECLRLASDDGGVEVRISRAEARAIVGPDAAVLDWPDGRLVIDVLTAEALVCLEWRSQDEIKLRRLSAALLSDHFLGRVLAGA
ncbi:MAG: hypothetical protein LKM39_11485 [Chiayiivirga sp.]|nr:hypothetical protein [Chiayiivirga sp.]